MKNKCIICGHEWGVWLENEVEEFSHGLCKGCVKRELLPKIRNKQLKEGNWDCFGKSKGYCNQELCKYLSVCTKLNEE
jgi:hypothetical protein